MWPHKWKRLLFAGSEPWVWGSLSALLAWSGHLCPHCALVKDPFDGRTCEGNFNPVREKRGMRWKLHKLAETSAASWDGVIDLNFNGTGTPHSSETISHLQLRVSLCESTDVRAREDALCGQTCGCPFIISGFGLFVYVRYWNKRAINHSTLHEHFRKMGSVFLTGLINRYYFWSLVWKPRPELWALL